MTCYFELPDGDVITAYGDIPPINTEVEFPGYENRFRITHIWTRYTEGGPHWPAERAYEPFVANVQLEEVSVDALI